MSREEEAAIATVFATPAVKAIRPLIEHLNFVQIDEIVARIRREVWQDYSDLASR